MSKVLLVTQIIRYLEGVRIAEGMSVNEFAIKFNVTRQSYYRWMRSSRKGGTRMNIDLLKVEEGLGSLGYDPQIIITKAERR